MKRWSQGKSTKVFARPSPPETLFQRALAAVAKSPDEPHVLYVKPRRQGTPIVTRTPAQIEVLRKRHLINRQAFIKTMKRSGVLTEAEAARQYDEEHGTW